MKVFSSDRSLLMEIKEVTLADDKFLISGVIMGGLPMNAFASPMEIRTFLRQIGIRKLIAMAWAILTCRAERGADN